VGISKKCTLKKFSSNSKEENKLKILQFLSNLKEKNKIAFNFLYAIKKLNFLVVFGQIFFIWMTKITNKKLSFLIAYRKLNAILFFSFKFDKNCKNFNLFSPFEFEENFFNVHFFEIPTCFYLFSAEIYFRDLRPHTRCILGAYVPFLGSEVLFSFFLPLIEYLILIHIKFPINRY
jgi:hypothetical protein